MKTLMHQKCLHCWMLRNLVIFLITFIVICSINIQSVRSQKSDDIKAKPNSDQKQDNGLASDVKDSKTDSIQQGDLNDVQHQHQSSDNKVKEGDKLPIKDIKTDSKKSNNEGIKHDNDNKNEIPIENKFDNMQNIKNSEHDAFKNSKKSEQKFESVQIDKSHEASHTIHSQSPDLPVKEKTKSQSQPTSQEKSLQSDPPQNKISPNSEHEHTFSKQVQSEQLKSDLSQHEQNLQSKTQPKTDTPQQTPPKSIITESHTKQDYMNEVQQQSEKQLHMKHTTQEMKESNKHEQNAELEKQNNNLGKFNPQQAETQSHHILEPETQIEHERKPQGTEQNIDDRNSEANARDEHKISQKADTKTDAQKEQVKDTKTQQDSIESTGNEHLNTKYTSYKFDQHTNHPNTNYDPSVDKNQEDEGFELSEEDFEADLKTMKEYWEQKLTEEQIKNYEKKVEEEDEYIQKLKQVISDEKQLLKDNEEYLKKLKSVISDEKQLEDNEEFLKKFKHLVSNEKKIKNEKEDLNQGMSDDDDDENDDGNDDDNDDEIQDDVIKRDKKDQSSEKEQVLKMHGKIYERIDLENNIDKNKGTSSSEQDTSNGDHGGGGGGGDDTKIVKPDTNILSTDYMTTDDFPEPFKRESLDIEKVAGIYTYAKDNVKETMIVYKPDEFGYAKLEKYIQTLTGSSIMTDYEEYFELLPERVTHKHILDQYEGDLPTSGANKDQESDNKESKTEDTEEVELSPEEIKAKEYFEKGEALINETYVKDHEQAHEYFQLAAKLNHTKALEYVAFAHIFGDYLPQNLTRAVEIFEDLSSRGVPRGQLGLGFMHASGIGKNSSQAKALVYLTFAALGGDPLAQMSLGYRYWSGIGVEMKCETALTYYKKVATTVASAVKMSGGPVVHRVRLQEEAESQTNGGQTTLLDDDLLQYYHFLADKGDVQAQVVLGQLYYQGGRGVGINHERAHHYFLMAAESGNANALGYLGKMYAEGSPAVEQNNKTAHQYFKNAADKFIETPIFVSWALKAAWCKQVLMNHKASHCLDQNPILADAIRRKFLSSFSPDTLVSKPIPEMSLTIIIIFGNPIGQTGLGLLYLYGKGVDKDFTKAYRYFTLSADQGWVEGQLQLGIMYMTGQGVKRDYKLAVKYFNLASQGGHVLAFHHLATMHASGIGVLRNCHTAVELFKNVAERGRWAEMLMDAHTLYKEGHLYQALLKYTFLAEMGYEVAQSNVAYLLDQGEVGIFNEYETHQRALLQYSRAAAQGSTIARVKMGDYHYYGYGTEIDYESAATHYRVATEQQHNAQAMFNLGYMHEQGLGLKQDVHLAKRFYDMAAETSNDAHVPVFLALMKLGLFYGVDIFNKEFEGYQNLLRRIDVRHFLGPDWDIYIITFLSLILGFVILLRRVR